jgi:hypothetical protein
MHRANEICNGQHIIFYNLQFKYLVKLNRILRLMYFVAVVVVIIIIVIVIDIVSI